TLTLSAYRDIIIDNENAGSDAVISNTGAGNLVLRADNSGRGVGSVLFTDFAGGSGVGVDFTGSTGSVSAYYNPPSNVPMADGGTNNEGGTSVNNVSYTDAVPHGDS